MCNGLIVVAVPMCPPSQIRISCGSGRPMCRPFIRIHIISFALSELVVVLQSFRRAMPHAIVYMPLQGKCALLLFGVVMVVDARFSRVVGELLLIKWKIDNVLRIDAFNPSGMVLL